MKKRVVIMLSIALGIGTDCAYSQSRGGASSSTKESFQEFRRKIKQDFNDFRNHILEQYADFLEGEWHPYEPLIVTRDKTPKPVKQPAMSEKPLSDSPKPGRNITPKLLPLPNSDTIPANKEAPSNSLPQAAGVDNFFFYGIPLQLRHEDFNILNRVSSPSEAASQWRELQKGKAANVAKAIDELAGKMGFNGYLTFRLIEAYLKSRFPSASESAIMSATHFMLVNMGFDARFGISSSGIPLMLIPMEQTVYGSLFLVLDGRSFTAFAPDGTNIESLRNITINTCQLPAMKEKGRIFDLKLNGLNIPERKKNFLIESGGLTLQGELNENLFAMLYRYPQMPTEDFAMSIIDKDLRASLVQQVRSQLRDMDEQQAVNTLLSFFHGLPYETDDQRHGFEKPYFLEETLYYDKCDCEDRAIMFTWLLWNALGIPNHLIAYPGHESAAVKLHGTPQRKAGYSWGNSTYWSADPTFIGASIGDVMPMYSTTVPHIDLSYE